MGSFREIDDFFNKLSGEFLREEVPNIIAEKATAFFQERFTTKEWDGKPWPETKTPVKRGSLMVRSGALMKSIKPSLVTPEKVIISGGSDKVNYARVHNEGGVINHPGGTSFVVKDKKAVFVSKKDAFKWASKTGNELPKTKPHQIKMPERRFMGTSDNLNQILLNAIKEAFNKL